MISLPITNPTWIFFIVMVIILLAPILFKKLHIPSIIGMILAGIIVGTHGFNILERDSSFELFGRVGIYYIMFLAGLETDINDLWEHRRKGMTFGTVTFLIPMALGVLSSLYILNYGILTAILLASMYASHTLLAYPVISRKGLSREPSVTTTIAGTALATTLALLVLAIVIGITHERDAHYWLFFVLKFIFVFVIILFGMPLLTKWLLNKYSDDVMQFVGTLAIVFLSGALMEFAGLEGILGAFFVGVVINPIVNKNEILTRRINFVGNAIFIPYFLIGVGMLINIRAFFVSGEALKVALVMTTVATFSKWLSAFITQKIYGMKAIERQIIFGLSNAQAAATLAAVLIGHEIFLADGSRLLSDHILNGTIVMILLTCIISTLVTEKAVRKLTKGQA